MNYLELSITIAFANMMVRFYQLGVFFLPKNVCCGCGNIA